MRFAAVVAPSYERATAASRRIARLADVLADRLAEPDAGYQVEVLEARGRVGDRLAHLLTHRSSPGPVLVVVSGDVVLSDDLEPALALSGGATLTFEELRSALAAVEGERLLIVDAGHAPDEDDPAASVSLVAAVRDAMDPRASGISLMVGARPLDEERAGPSTFISGVLAAIEQCSATLKKTGRVGATRIYETLRADEERFHRIPAAGWFPGRGEFPVLAQPSIVIGGSDSMPPSVRPSNRPSASRGVTVSLPPAELSPAVDEAWKAGNAAAALSDHQQAIDHYKRALLMLGKKPERADLYFRIGRAKEALGSDAEAVLNYDKALGIEPLHHDAFQCAARLLKKQGDFTHVERLLQRRLDARSDEDAKARELTEIIKLWMIDAESPKQAILHLEKSLAKREDPDVLEQLVEALEHAGRPAAAIETRKRLAAVLTDEPARRARVLLEAARAARDHLPQGGDAVQLARAALEADASALEALEVAAALLGAKRRYRELAALYDLVIERTEDPVVAWDLAKRLGLLHRDELDDAAGAKRAFQIASEKNPEDVELKFWLAELFEAEQDYAAAGDQMRSAAVVAADRVDVYRRALWCFEKTGEADSAWNAACVLDQLGDADINESLLADTHRPDGLIAARGALDDEDWATLRSERDEPLEELIQILTPAAIQLRCAELEKSGRAPKLDDTTLQNPGGTTTLVRSMVWTARLLGMPVPVLHVLPSVEGELSPLPLEELTAAAGKAVGSGLDLAELAFLWGRVLSYFHGEHRLLVFYPAVTDIARLLLAGLSVAGVEDATGDVAKLADALDAELTDSAREELVRAAGSFRKKRVAARVERFVLSVHASAGRAGLLSCGDLARALALSERFPLRADVTMERQLGELRAFSISRDYATLRERIGVAVRP